MLDGVLFLDEPGRLIIGLPFNGETAFSVNSMSSLGDRDAAEIPESGNFTELGHSQLLYQRKYGNLRMYIPCSVTESPATVEELARAIITVIETYFGKPLTQSLLEANKATVVLLLSEMFDAGMPRITEPDILKQLVPQENFFKWLLPGAGSSSTSSRSAVDAAASGTVAAGPQSKLTEQQLLDDRVPWEIPWRRARVKHSSQELYVDIIEHANVLVMSKSSQQRQAYSSHIIPALPSRVQVSGKIAILSKLNGPAPHVSIELDGVLSGATGARLHRCIDRAKWVGSQGRTLAFVPPDGESVVASYQTVVNTQGPVLAELRREENGTCEIRLATLIDSKVSGITNLVAKVIYPAETKIVKELSSTGGDFDVSNPQKCNFRFEKSIPMGWQASLRASAFDNSDEPVQPLYVELQYSLVGRVPSKIAVKGIHIVQSSQPAAAASSEGKPFKGVRYQTITDSYVVR